MRACVSTRLCGVYVSLHSVRRALACEPPLLDSRPPLLKPNDASADHFPAGPRLKTTTLTVILNLAAPAPMPLPLAPLSPSAFKRLIQSLDWDGCDANCEEVAAITQGEGIGRVRAGIVWDGLPLVGPVRADGEGGV